MIINLIIIFKFITTHVFTSVPPPPTLYLCCAVTPSHPDVWQIVRKVVRRGKGSGEDGVQEMSMEGSLQDANELEVDAEQYMSYAVLGRDGGKVGFWSAK